MQNLTATYAIYFALKIVSLRISVTVFKINVLVDYKNLRFIFTFCPPGVNL